MATSTIKATLPWDVQKVWALVTALENHAWRSDLSNIEQLSETQFVEYTKDGFATTFTITATEPMQRWEFDLENHHIRGHWTGLFPQADGGTTITFTEDVVAKKLLMKPFVKAYLKKQQATYLADLKNALSR